jgi:hypothetical protein
MTPDLDFATMDPHAAEDFTWIGAESYRRPGSTGRNSVRGTADPPARSASAARAADAMMRPTKADRRGPSDPQEDAAP